QEDGLKTAWDEMTKLVDWRRDHGHFDERRAEQARYWFEQEVRQGLLAQLETPDAKAAMQAAAKQVAAGEMTPTAGAQAVLRQVRGG
ncbi:MAG: methylmalonyl Co-A mutase-associated GTPase MeaB, partial [Pseudomonadota bacterium]